MAAKRKVPPRVFTPAELDQIAQELVERKNGLSGGDIKKELGAEYKGADKGVLEAAHRLAARGVIHRWSDAKKVRFFRSDPFDGLAAAVRQALGEGAMTEVALRERVESTQRGLGDLLKGWMKGAIARGELYEHPPAPGTRLKRYARSPNVPSLLKKVSAELAKVVVSPVGQRVDKAELLECLAAQLGVGASARERFLVQLCGLALDRRTDGLLPIRALRERVQLNKPEFDRVALVLSKDELVTLHFHDFPASLSEEERAQLVAGQNGTYFVGIAPRRSM